PEAMLERYLLIMILPDLPDYPRPVVAFFALDDSGNHHEELKGGWVNIYLKSPGYDRVQVNPDFPVFPTTEVLSIPLKEAGRLTDALHRSGGAYDVALIDPGRKGARIWHQVGDLDPTGNIYRVVRELLPENLNDEAARCLDDAVSDQPWLSVGWVHKGLMAKRAGDMAGARKAFEKAIEVQPHDPVAITRLGVLDKNENRMESSEELLLKSLRILPVQPSAICTLGAGMLGRLADGDSKALPVWDYYIGGLHAYNADGQDFSEISKVSASLDRSLATNSKVVPVDSVFYL
ncbi:MAG: tetratricopeptide repeat protein, partial [Candidatus Rifleibacteriota bacterium]